MPVSDSASLLWGRLQRPVSLPSPCETGRGSLPVFVHRDVMIMAAPALWHFTRSSWVGGPMGGLAAIHLRLPVFFNATGAWPTRIALCHQSAFRSTEIDRELPTIRDRP